MPRVHGKYMESKWKVNGINAIDEENEIIYFNAKKESEMENHVYSVRFNGSRLKRLTKEEGSHSASFSPTKNYFIDTHSSFTRTPETVLRSNSGSIKGSLAKTDRSKFDDYGFTYPRHVNLFTDDGESTIKKEFNDNPHEYRKFVDKI